MPVGGSERGKVEQICNSVFYWDIWNDSTQLPPSAICAQNFVNLQPAEHHSSWAGH